ncbi:methyltransferase type 11 [Pseudomonas aeruginosa]|uniref:methyltransferase type 11 n=1 Tax=Pseudomonas aeruginosa TaxID=287 RepID=UPI0011503F5F|nr:methyltransferase type 11 [Pseudomonas aeruginosa]TQI13126.1 methyltransferase type 11 [Pseudomonas aeruginosa]
MTNPPARFKPALAYADCGRTQGPMRCAAFFTVQLLDGFETMRDAVAGRLPTVFAQGTKTGHFIAAFCILSLHRVIEEGS